MHSFHIRSYAPAGRPRTRRLSAALATAALTCAGAAVAPTAFAAAPSPSVSVVAGNLDNPRGLAFNPHGDLFVAEAGHGGPLCLGEGPEGPACAGLTSGISMIRGGHATKVVDGLISIGSPDGTAAEGVSAVSTQGLRLYAQMAGNTHQIPPDAPSSPVLTAARAQLGRTLSVSDHSWAALASTGDTDWTWTNERKELAPNDFPDANPNAIETMGRTQYVADAGANLIAKVDNHGKVSTLAFLSVPPGSASDSVPSCIATAPDGALYVGELLGGQYAPGHARVWRIVNGVASVKWTGFTGIQGCGFDDAGNFYATEFQAHGMFGPDPAGAVIQVTPAGKRTVLGAGSLFFPSGFAYRNGAVYVSNWSIMPADNHGAPTGQVVKIPVG
jgi:hypothetical protein